MTTEPYNWGADSDDGADLSNAVKKALDPHEQRCVHGDCLGCCTVCTPLDDDD